MDFRELDLALLRRIEGTWMSFFDEAQDVVGAAEYEQLFATIKQSNQIGPLDVRLNTAIYFATFDGEDDCLGLVEVVQSRKGCLTWVKMMDITLCPAIDLKDDDEANTTKRLAVFKTALSGLFKLTQNADTVKIYGRTDALITFLKGMHDALAVVHSLGTLGDISVSIEGRWLVFRSSRC